MTDSRFNEAMTEHAASRPRVSVIVPVWNVAPWLRECLDSVVSQTIGLEQIELITVDDGSTDGSERILDDYAERYPQVKVIHEPNSGGPGRPRNVGLDHATAEYVFFLDADDYLGLEALERLVRMADRNTSEIVIGKLVGIAGRRVYRDTGVFRQSVDRVDLERVYDSRNVLKLIRRSLIERIGLRFNEAIPGGEDGDFMSRLYLDATTISVVADYDCYFVRRREGSQTRRRDRHDDLGVYIARLETVRIGAVAGRRAPGPSRDKLLVGHFLKMLRKFGRRWLALEPAERRRIFDVAAGVVDRWYSDDIRRALPARARIRAHCLEHGLLAELEDIVACRPPVAYGDPVEEGDRVYARFPHFRDGSGIPDICFDITDEIVPWNRVQSFAVTDGMLVLSGMAYLTLLGGATEVELRRWPRGVARRFAATAVPTPELRDRDVAYPTAGFEAAIELATAMDGSGLPRGAWSIGLSIGTGRVERSTRVRAARNLTSGRGLHRPAGRPGSYGDGAAVYVTRRGDLRLRIGRPQWAVTLLESGEVLYARLVRLLIRALRSWSVTKQLTTRISMRRRALRGRMAEF